MKTARFFALGALALFLAPASLLAQAAPAEVIHGFAFVQASYSEGSTRIIAAKLHVWDEKGPWSFNLETDARQESDQIKQVWIGKETRMGILRAGRMFLADENATVPLFKNPMAIYPRSADAPGPFFGWGVQFEGSSGRNTLLADVAWSGPNYHALGGAVPAVSAYFKRGGDDNYVAGAGRFGDGLRRLAADSGYKRGKFAANVSAYYQDAPHQDRRLTGLAFGEWRVAARLAPHVQVDVPPTDGVIYSAGVGAGDLEHLYLAVDHEWAGSRSGWAARMQFRTNFGPPPKK